MAGTSQLRKSVLGIINEVERKMAYTPSATLSARRTTLMYEDFLNDIVADISDYGQWPQLFCTVQVTAAGCVASYEINASAPVQNIAEVALEGQISPLYPVLIPDMRVLQRTSGRGTPRQFAFSHTSGVNPFIDIYPIPDSANSGKAINTVVYTKPAVYTTADGATVVPFSSRLCVQGVYAKALLDENGGQANPQYQVAYTEFSRMLKEEWNRENVDTGSFTDIYLRPQI